MCVSMLCSDDTLPKERSPALGPGPLVFPQAAVEALKRETESSPALRASFSVVRLLNDGH